LLDYCRETGLPLKTFSITSEEVMATFQNKRREPKTYRFLPSIEMKTFIENFDEGDGEVGEDPKWVPNPCQLTMTLI
jgi:hypothetical protein